MTSESPKGIMRIDAKHVNILADIAGTYYSYIYNRFRPFLEDSVGRLVPPELQSFYDGCLKLRHLIDERRPSGGEIPDHFRPLLRSAVAAIRRNIAIDVEQRREKVIHKELLESLDEKLRPYDELMRLEYLRDAEAFAEPQLAEFFPIKVLENSRDYPAFPARAYDEKFRILQASPLFQQDLEWTRRASSLRNLTFAVAYLDIDEFGKFNRRYTEPVVDRFMLPKFMRRVEAHVFMRGQAYRIGGDEYCVIVNNVTESEALNSLELLRQAIAGLEYEGIEHHATVSIGLVVVAPACHLTGHEIESAAAIAKKFAKDQGRNQVAAFRSQIFEEEQLYIASPSPASVR